MWYKDIEKCKYHLIGREFDLFFECMRPCKKQCIFGGHHVVQIIAPFFVYDEPPILGLNNRKGPSFMMV